MSPVKSKRVDHSQLTPEWRHEAAVWESEHPRKTWAKATGPPWEPEPNESLTQQAESDTTHQWVVTTADSETRCPASGPSLQHTTTPKLPAAHTDTAHAH